MITSELHDHIDTLVATSKPARASGWEADVTLAFGDKELICLSVRNSGVEVHEVTKARGTILYASSEEALRRWLIDGVDYTHLVASGDFTIHGGYFDVLLLSKVLGLRPERIREVAK